MGVDILGIDITSLPQTDQSSCCSEIRSIAIIDTWKNSSKVDTIAEQHATLPEVIKLFHTLLNSA